MMKAKLENAILSPLGDLVKNHIFFTIIRYRGFESWFLQERRAGYANIKKEKEKKSRLCQ